MKYWYFFIVSLHLFAWIPTKAQPKEVSVKLEINITETKEFGKLISLSILIENHTNKNIYLDGIYPVSFKIFWQVADGTFEDYSEGWLTDEVSNPNGELIGKLNGQNINENKIYDELSNRFTDSISSKFYVQQIIKNTKVINSREDTLDVREWVRFNFEGILYFASKRIYKSTIGISSLAKGVYKIYFDYSNKNHLERKIALRNKLLQLDLPKTLKGFDHWRGDIKSDTLYLIVR